MVHPFFELLDDYRQYSLIDEFELLGLEQGVELARPKVDWEEGLFVVTAGQVAVISETGEERFRFEVNDALGGIVLPAKAKLVATKAATLIHIGSKHYSELYEDHPAFRGYIERLRKLIGHALGQSTAEASSSDYPFTP